MAARKSLWCGSATGIVNDNAIRYFPVGDVRLTVGNGYGATGLEVDTQVPYRTAGIHSHLSVVASSNGSADAVVTFRIDRGLGPVDGNQRIVVPAGAALGVFTDATHTDATSAGDLVDVKVDSSASGCSLSLIVINGAFLSSSGSTVKKYLTGGYPSTVSGSGGPTKYCILGGQEMSFGAGSGGSQPFSQTEVLANAAFKCTANSLDGVVIITLQKNGVDTAITMTLPAGSTALIEDTTHSATFDNTDLVNWKFDMSACSSGTFQPSYIAVESTCASGATRMFAGNGSASISGFYVPVGGDAININAPTSFGVPFTASNMQVECGSNNTDELTNFAWYQNGSPGNMLVVVPAGTTGVFDDTTNTDAVGATDPVIFAVGPFANSGFCFFDINFMTLADAEPASPSLAFIDSQHTPTFVRSGRVM